MPGFRDTLTGNPRRSALREQLLAEQDRAVLDQVDRVNLDQQSSVARGAQMGAAGMTAGSFADEALDAQLAGNLEQQRALEAQAQHHAGRASVFAPDVRSLRDVHSASDFGTLVGGHLGQAAVSMAPVLAGAVAARTPLRGLMGRTGATVMPYMGAAIPAYQLEKGEAVLGQLLDPELAAKPAEERLAAAQGKAVVNAALESIVPAGLSRGLGQVVASPLRTIERAMIDEGLTEAAQETSGMISEETLRRGSLVDALNQPITDDMRMRVADAGFAGMVGGGGMSVPTAGSQAVANALEAGKDKALEAGSKAVETTQELVAGAKDKAKGARGWADEVLERAGNDDNILASELGSRGLEGEFLPRDEAEAELNRASAAGDVMGVRAALDRQQAEAPSMRARAAQAVLNLKDAPDALKSLAQRVLDGSADENEQASILGLAQGHQVARKTKTLAAHAVVAIDEASEWFKDVGAQALERVKLNAQETGEADELNQRGMNQRLVESLFSELRPELQQDASVRGKLEPLAKLFRELDVAAKAEGANTASYDTMRRLAPALAMFNDPGKIVPKGLRKMYDDVTRAQTEARDDNSWLSQNLTPAFSANPKARAELGKLLDHAALGEELDRSEMSLLQRAFGSKGAAKTMLRHYKLQVPMLRRTRQEAVEDEAETNVEAELDEDTGFTEREGEFTTHYAGSNQTPFLNQRKSGERTPAHQRARELRESGERAQVLNLADLAREKGADLAQEAQRLRDNFMNRLEKGEVSAEEEVLHEALGNDDLGLLRAHQVVRTTKPDNASDTLMRSHELKSKAALLAKQADNPRATPEQRAAAKSTLFTVTRTTGGKQTLSAESLWKYFGTRQQDVKGKSGIREGESKTDAARIQDLFSQAISELALDPEVESIDLPQGVVLDRASGQTLAEDQNLTKEQLQGKFKRGKHDAAAMQALNDNQFAQRAKAIANNAELSVGERLDKLADARVEHTAMQGPRRAYVKRRNQMLLDAMKNLVNKLVPHPSEAEAEAFGKGETEAFGEATQRTYDAQLKYVEDLREVIEGVPELADMLDGAEARLQELEEQLNPPRLYDETTGEATTPSAKRAGTKTGPMRQIDPARETPARQEVDEFDSVIHAYKSRGAKEISEPSEVPQPTASDKRFKFNQQDITFDDDFVFDEDELVLDFEQGVENNGSGDSSASIEAINRQRDEKVLGQTRLLIDRDGTVRQLQGVDAVDTHARAGQIIVQRNIGKDEWTILSQGNDISKDLAQGRLNAARARFNSQQRKSTGGISRELKNKIAAEMKRIQGFKTGREIRQHLGFVKAKEIGNASGAYDPATRAIRIAYSALNPMSVYYHEALHDFINTLQQSEHGRALRKSLFRAAEMPHVRAQLKELLKDHPKALAAVEADAEERVAYLFQFWATGKYLGQDLIKVRNADANNAFAKLARWIRQLIGVVGQDERAERVFEKLYDGGFANQNVVGEIIHDMKLDTLADKARRLAGPLADVYDKLMLAATDRLRGFGVDSLDQIADMFATEPGREQGGLRFLQRRSQTAAKYVNELAKLFKDSTAEQRAVALRNLQSMQAPSTPLEHQVRKLLDDMWQYLADSGVARLDPATGQWKDLAQMDKPKNYFPRVWDPRKIQNNENEFRQLLFKYGGMKPDQQSALIDMLVHSDGHTELADNEYHVGYTPFAKHVQDRKLTFIDDKNAAEFAKFQNGDLADILKGYIFQAVHRAEFAKDFGNDGRVLTQALEEAANHLDDKQVQEAAVTMKGLVGTLGADINPRMKDVMSAALTAQNVILLPLTMFSQFIDALGVGLRAQAPEEAWNAFKRGMGDFAKAVAKRKLVDDDYDTEMAKTLGLIDEENIFESMGQAHAGAFMSKFARDVNRKFFRWNGMESWNRSMRVSAMVAGERFIQRELDNSRYMNELGLSKDDVMIKPDGRLAVTADQMRALGATKKQAEAREKKIQTALFRFVDGAVLRPNAAQRPVWGSDPHYMLLFHLKQFAFSFQKTILSRVSNEYEHGKMMPGAILAAYVPVMMASGLAKATLTGQPIGDGSMLDLLNYGVMRSGILGTQAFSTDAMGDLQRGQLPGTSLLGPTLEHAWTASRFLVGDPQTDVGAVLDRSVPFARYF